MNKPISQSEKQVVFDKRQNLFSLWQGNEDASDASAAPAPQAQPQRPPAQPAPAQRQADEVQDLLKKFVNPNADRWSVF